MVLGGSGGRELAVLFVYLDPDVLPAGFRGRSQRGAAAGEGIEDQGAGDGGSFDELLQQRHGLLVGVGEALVSDLGAGDQVVRPFSRELVASLGCEDDGLISRGKRSFQVSHAVRLFVPHDDRLDRQASETQRVDEYLLNVPAGKTEYPPPARFTTLAAS